jgi:hypothetical protein
MVKGVGYSDVGLQVTFRRRYIMTGGAFQILVVTTRRGAGALKPRLAEGKYLCHFKEITSGIHAQQ